MEDQAKILIVDDQEMNIELMKHLLGAKGYEIFAALSGPEALKMVETVAPDVIILDLVMPEMNGYEVCELIKLNPKTRHVPVIILTGAPQEEANIRALDSGADDFLQRPFNAAFLDARIRNCIRTKKLQDSLLEYRRRLEEYNEKLESRIRERTEQLEKTQHATVFALAKLAESRDTETGKHLERIRGYGKEIAEELAGYDGLKDSITEDFIDVLFNASPLHDIGKVGIPDRILLKPGKLTPEEFDIMKRHTEIGGDTLAAVEEETGGSPLIAMGRDIAYYHHERWDGSGYPRGLKGDHIPLAARIINLADCYDALVSKRCYKEPFSHEKAKEIILGSEGTQFDPDVIKAFLKREERFRAIHFELQDSDPTTWIQKVVESLDSNQT